MKLDRGHVAGGKLDQFAAQPGNASQAVTGRVVGRGQPRAVGQLDPHLGQPHWPVRHRRGRNPGDFVRLQRHRTVGRLHRDPLRAQVDDRADHRVACEPLHLERRPGGHQQGAGSRQQGVEKG
ncbi:MAG: hypothetical protein A2V98_18285 [Planctomycetes bacterium RBG_16_64_12]|nr:MAG: hypothetical protein A2V98_18285 [Planctomycetes bacterium RBG_16_64_12]